MAIKAAQLSSITGIMGYMSHTDSLLLRLTNRSSATYNVKEYNLIEGVR